MVSPSLNHSDFQIFNNSPIGFAVYNNSGQCILINSSFLSITASKNEDITDKSLKDLCILKNDAGLLKKALDILNGGGIYREEININKCSGEQASLDIVMQSYIKQDESYLLIMLFEILSKPIDNVLPDYNRHDYKDIFFNSPLGIYQTTPDGNILMANPALIRMLGYSSFDELVKRNLETEGYLNIDETREKFKRKLEQAGELTGYENAWLTRDGRIIYIRENARVIKKHDGQIFYEGTVEDITDKVLAGKELKESEKRFRMLFDGNPDPVLLANPKTGVIIDANISACSLLKYAPNEIIGKDISDLARPDRKEISKDVFNNLVRLSASGEKTLPHEGYLQCSDGRAVPVEVVVQMIIIHGEPVLLGVFRDLSERKKIEDALIDSEENYRLVFESSIDAIFISAPDGKIYHANPAAIKMLGYSEEEIIRLGREGILDTTDPNLYKAIKERENTGQFFAELKYIKSDGTMIPVETSSKIFRLKDGSIRTCIIARDITEKKKSEQIIHDTLELSSKIFDSSPIGIAIYKESGQCISANENFGKIIGAAREQVLAQNFRELKSWKNSGIFDIADEVLKSSSEVHKEVHVITTFGKDIWMNLNAICFYSRGEKHLMLMNYEITERKRTEEALRISEERFRRIFIEGPLGMGVIGLDYKFINVNPKLCEITGYTEEELTGITFPEITHPDDITLDLHEAEKLLNGEIPFYSMNKRYIRKDSSVVWINLTGTIIRKPDGSPLYFLALIEDISQRKKSEEDLRRNEELTRSILNSLTAHVAVIDNNGDIIAINKAWNDFAEANDGSANLLGVGTNYLDSCRKAMADIPEAKIAFDGILSVINREADQFSIEYSCHSPNEKRWFLMNVSSLHSYRGATISHRSITQLKLAEEELRKNERLLKTVLEALPVGIFVAGENGQIILSNDEAGRIWGGQKYVDLENYNEYKAWWYKTGEKISSRDWALSRAFRKGTRSLNEILTIECFDGTNKIIQNSAVPIYASDDNAITGAVAVLQDITKRIEMENRVISSEKRFRSLIQNSSDVVLLLDLEGNLKYVSPSVTNVTGFTPEEQLNTPGLSWIHPEDAKNVLASFESLKSQPGRTERSELRILNKNGEWIWTEAIATNLLDEPSVESFVVNYRDINERKNSELKLLESEERFRTSIENMLDSFAILEAKRDEDGKITDFIYKYINDAGCRSNIMSREELLGRGLLEMLPLHKETGLFYEYCHVVETGKPLVKESMFYEDNYSGRFISRVFEISAVKLGDGFAVAWRDISRKKQAEAAQRISDSRYRALASNFPNGAVFLFDRDLRYIVVEGSEIVKIGMNKEYMEGKTIYELFSQEITSVIEPSFIGTFDGLENTLEIEILGNMYEVRTLPIKSDFGDIIAGMAMIQNINERKRIEGQLKDLNESKDKFFSIIAHDLKSPFTALLGLSEFVANDFESLTTEEIKSFSVNIYKSAKSVFDLLDNLLQWARFQTGRMEFSPSVFPISDLLEEAINLYRVSQIKKNISIELSIDEDIKVYADRYMIDTVIRNLLSNAIKFTPNGGEIRITAEASDHYSNFSISDTGVGISEENIKRIFNLGQRISTLGTNKETGTGLGLILCKEFIEKNNGELYLESKAGLGTKFMFMLPNEHK